MTSKQISDKLAENGIKMHFNSKREKLEEALNNLPITEGDNMEAVTEETQEIPTAVLITADQLDDFKFNGVELEGLREDNTMKLIRVIVRPMTHLNLSQQVRFLVLVTV